MPSRHASREELLALCAVVREHPGTTLEFIPAVGRFTDEVFDVMAAMSRTADRPLNWNLLQVYAQNWDLVQHQLSGYDYAAERGGKVFALTLPDTFRLRLNLRSGFILDILNGWDRLMALPDAEKLALLRDPAGRAEMDRLAQTTEGQLRAIGNWGAYVLLETFDDEYRRFEGRLIGDIAAELGRSPWDTLADIAVADELRTVIANQDKGQDEASWARRVEVWRDGRAIVGASDAGAHLDMIDSFSFSTTLLARTVRERSLLPMEEAIHFLTGSPAALYGLRDRGRLAVGAHADVVVLDPATIGPGPVHTRFDLPGRRRPHLRRGRGHRPRPRQRDPRRRRGRGARRPPRHAASLRARHRHGHRGLSGSSTMTTTPRIPPLPPDRWDPEIRPLLEANEARMGRPLNIFATFANHPKLLKRWSVLANHALFKTTLPARERELLILRTGFRCGSDYEWGQHVGIAREAELADVEIDRVAAGPGAEGWSRADRALLQAADELHDDQVVADATWDELSLDWDTEQLMDIVFTVGIYTQIAMALRSFGVEREDGVPGLPDGAG